MLSCRALTEQRVLNFEGAHWWGVVAMQTECGVGWLQERDGGRDETDTHRASHEDRMGQHREDAASFGAGEGGHVREGTEQMHTEHHNLDGMRECREDAASFGAGEGGRVRPILPQSVIFWTLKTDVCQKCDAY